MLLYISIVIVLELFTCSSGFYLNSGKEDFHPRQKRYGNFLENVFEIFFIVLNNKKWPFHTLTWTLRDSEYITPGDRFIIR